MTVYLIDSVEASYIGEIPEEADFCFGTVAEDDQSRAWINEAALKGLRSIGREPELFEERAALPSFHGLASSIDTAGYGDELTVEALAADPEAVGVAYVGFNCEREFALQLVNWRDRFFHFSLKESRPFIWLILSDPSGQYDDTGREVARWAFDVLYNQDENFKAWLEGLGFDLTEEDEEEEV